MTGHPVVEAAAVALNLGWDPLRYLRASGLERTVADAVVREAQKIHVEEMGRFAEAVGHHAAVALSKMFSG